MEILSINKEMRGKRLTTEGCGGACFWIGVMLSAFVAGLVSRTFVLTTFRSRVFVETYPSFSAIRMGPPFFPANHSSASRAGSGPAVSGYRSSWKRSDWADGRRHNAVKRTKQKGDNK